VALAASAAAIVAGLAVGCSDSESAHPVDLVEGVEVRVSAIDNLFRPDDVVVRAGTEVVWSNDGRNNHDVVPADDDGWGVPLAQFGPGATYQHRFVEPGTYRYYCTIHGTAERGMTGTVTVTTD
jgi:plastocyanin